jgi:hypothetical protein
VVENRPGGDGLVALNAFLGAHDDHTLFFGPASTFLVHLYDEEENIVHTGYRRATFPLRGGRKSPK